MIPDYLVVVDRSSLYLALFFCGAAGFIIGCWASVTVTEGRCPWCNLPPLLRRVQRFTDRYRGPGRPSRPLHGGSDEYSAYTKAGLGGKDGGVAVRPRLRIRGRNR